MAMYSFVPPFREAKFCVVPEKLGCAAGEKSLRNPAVLFHTSNFAILNYWRN
jgi:hypothetical protein